MKIFSIGTWIYFTIAAFGVTTKEEAISISIAYAAFWFLGMASA